MRDLVAIQRGLILVPDGGEAALAAGTRLAASLQAELMKLGWTLDPIALEAVARAPRDWVVAFHADVLPALRQQLGADRAYEPFYRNFPADVMAASDVELFLNAVLHYLSGGAWEPPQVLRDRGFAFEDVTFRPLRRGTDDDLRAAFTALVALNQSLTEQDKQAVAWMIDHYRGRLTLPPAVPFKETLCLLAAKGLDVAMRSPTDVLRVAVYLSGGDVSLPGVPPPKSPHVHPQLPWYYAKAYADAHAAMRAKFRFRPFARAERRLLLGLLEKSGADPSQMQRHLGRWLRLGERLHPGEFAARFPKSAAAFKQLRNQQTPATRVRTFAGQVDRALKYGWRSGVDLLATRPGELARRLDWLLRTPGGDADHVLAAFAESAGGVSAKVLIELHDHFRRRAELGVPRSVTIKGKRSKTKTLEPLPPMDETLVARTSATILDAIRRRIAALPPLGKVWVDPRLAKVPVPFAMRGMNAGVRTYVRGTRVPYRADAKVVRPYLHWHDADGTQDLDLSAGLYDEDLKLVSHLSFTNLRDEARNCCHSGDVRCRAGPCAEYVDLDVAACLATGVRYAALHAFNYQSRPMHTVESCVFGLMEREQAEANAAFLPKTISDAARLANEGTAVVVCVVDLRAGEYVWADVESDRMLATLENAAGRTAEVLRSLLAGTRLSIGRLLTLHAEARGTPVDDADDADLTLRWEDFVTDYAAVGPYTSF